MTGPTPTKMTADELRELIVDYLYDTLEPSVRAAFEEGLRGSPTLFREVDETARALQVSRRALRAASEPVPAGVRSAVVEAAARAVGADVEQIKALTDPSAAAATGAPFDDAQASGVGPGQHKGQTPGAQGGPGQPDGVPAWLRILLDLWRRPWAMPVVGAAAVIGLFFLARDVITHSEPLQSWRQQQAEQAAEAPSAGAVATEPEAQASLGAMATADDLEGERAARPAAPAASLPLPSPAKPAAPTGRSPGRDSAPQAVRRFAVPPSDWGPDRPAAGPAAEGAIDAPAAQHKAVAGSAARFDDGAVHPPAAPQATTARKKSAPAALAEVQADALASRAGGASPIDEKIRRAERFLAEKNFAEAARAYQDLLRDFPADPRVPIWKKRLADAQEAAARP